MFRSFLFAALACVLLVFPVLGQETKPNCPQITVAGPAGITIPGGVMVFSANLSSWLGPRPGLTYHWETSAGTIRDGQGTSKITVQTTEEDLGTNITATVTVKGLSIGCESKASEIGGVATRPVCGCSDEYGKIPWQDERARLDNFQIQLTNNPKARALIYIRTGHETVEKTTKHAIKMLKHFRSRQPDFDSGRVLFQIHDSEEERTTKLWVIPPGAKIPKCDGSCTLLEASTLVIDN